MTASECHIRQFSKRSLLVVLALIGAQGLGGCSKPPNCSEASTVKEITTGLAEKFAVIEKDSFVDDPNGLVNSFMASMKIVFETIVDDGYKSDSKKQMCRANVVLDTVGGQRETAMLNYGLQKDEKKGGIFISMDDVMPVMTTLDKHLANYFSANRYAGDWIGTYVCEALKDKDGSDEVQNEAHAAFSQQVTMHVHGSEAKLARPTKSGGFESLNGSIQPQLQNDGATLTISGSGKNSPEDGWKASFEGRIKGNNYQAQGGPLLGLAGALGEGRGCTLDLTFKPAR